MTIIGEYPCCGGELWIGNDHDDGSDAITPGYYTQSCPHCGEKVYHRISRFDPESWTEDGWVEAGGKPEKSR